MFFFLNLAFRIFSYIPEPMKATSVAARLDDILKTDWKSKAAVLLESEGAPVGLLLLLHPLR